MSFLIRRQEENKNQTVSHNQKPPLWQRGLHPPPGHPARQGETAAFQGHPAEFLFGDVRENQLFREMAVACPAWWEGSWFPGELVSKRKNNFKEIKKEKKKKGKLNWNYNWNILLVANDTHTYIHAPTHTHASTHVCTQKNTSTELSAKQKHLLREDGNSNELNSCNWKERVKIIS